MGGIDFTFVLAGSAFLLASWVDAKVGDSRPASPAKRIGLCLVGVVVLHLTVGGLYLIQAAGASQPGMMAAVLGLFLKNDRDAAFDALEPPTQRSCVSHLRRDLEQDTEVLARFIAHAPGRSWAQRAARSSSPCAKAASERRRNQPR